MLFFLTNSLIVNKDDSEYNAIYSFIQKISSAVIESKHLLNGEYEVLEYFSKIFSNVIDTGTLLSNLFNNYYTNPIPSFITYYIEIVKDSPIRREEEGKIVEQIEYKDINSINSLLECSLIGEDINDCIFYEHILSWYKKENNYICKTNFNKVQGGGDRTETAIRQDLTKKHVSICIIDTDKKYPEDTIKNNSTCGKCIKLGKNAILYKFRAIDVQEIENIIPINYIDKIEDWNKDTLKQNKENFDSIIRSDEAEYILPYYDLKKGIRKYRDLYEDELYRNFAKKCYRINKTEEEYNKFDNVFDGLAFYDEDKKQSILLPGLMSNILKKTKDLIKDPNLEEPLLLQFQRTIWNNIGKDMLNWGIARNSENVY